MPMPDVIHIDVPDLAGTFALGHQVAAHLFPGAVVALIGPLGAGKTQFVRAVAEGLGVTDSRLVNSPTFVLIQEYMGRLPIYHFDAYRLPSMAAFSELGVAEYFEGGGVCLVEWADRVEASLPGDFLRVSIEITGETTRRFTLDQRGSRYDNVLNTLERSRAKALLRASLPSGDAFQQG
jgi:tRNA threonylcarbamoyladenosine biosynthesis protein TsaE